VISMYIKGNENKMIKNQRKTVKDIAIPIKIV